jgi:hypothetical protein
VVQNSAHSPPTAPCPTTTCATPDAGVAYHFLHDGGTMVQKSVPCAPADRVNSTEYSVLSTRRGAASAHDRGIDSIVKDRRRLTDSRRRGRFRPRGADPLTPSLCSGYPLNDVCAALGRRALRNIQIRSLRANILRQEFSRDRALTAAALALTHSRRPLSAAARRPKFFFRREVKRTRLVHSGDAFRYLYKPISTPPAVIQLPRRPGQPGD